MAASSVELEPWHAVNSGPDGDSFFYVKFALDASDPRPAAEPAFVLLATDLLAVWECTVSHEHAPGWINEQYSTLAEKDPMVHLQRMRAVLLGLNTKLATEQPPPPPRISPSESDSSSLLIVVPITARVIFKLSCEKLNPEDAASVLREQMLLPALHMSALFAGHARVGGWDEGTATSAAEEHVSGGFSRLEFSGAIATVYQTIMARRRVGRASLSLPASEPVDEPATADASTVVPPTVEPVVASGAAQGASSPASAKREGPKLVISRPAKVPKKNHLPR